MLLGCRGGRASGAGAGGKRSRDRTTSGGESCSFKGLGTSREAAGKPKAAKSGATAATGTA